MNKNSCAFKDVMYRGAIPNGANFCSPDVGERIKDIRKYYKLTQEEFGETLGLTRNSISNIERGIIEPSVAILKCLHFIYDADLDYIAFGPTDEHLALVSSNHDQKQELSDILNVLNREEKAVLFSFAQFLVDLQSLNEKIKE